MSFCLAQFAAICMIISCHVLPKGDFIDILSSDCHHIHLIPFLLSFSFNNLIHIFLKISNSIHCWNLLWLVEPEPNPLGIIFHWQQVLRTCRIPFITFLNGIIGRPIVLFGFSVGSVELRIFHSSFEIFVMAGLFLLLWWIQQQGTL